MHVAETQVATILEPARLEGRLVLLEHEAYALLAELGLRTPRHRFIGGSAEAARFDPALLGTDRCVVKVVAPSIVHKTEVGGVAVARATTRDLVATVVEMERRLEVPDLRGFLVCEFVEHDRDPGTEMLVGLRHTAEFGPTVSLGPGGLFTEYLSSFPGNIVVLSPALAERSRLERALAGRAFLDLVTEGQRGGQPRLERDALVDLVADLLGHAARLVPESILELEINPLVLTPRGPVALDAWARLGAPPVPSAPPRPLWKLGRLVEPRTMAIVGVSERENPGRVILNNTLAEGFPAERLWVVKPGTDRVAGCPAVPDLASLPEAVDLLVIAVEAARVPEIVREAVEGRRAESMIVIPGGLGERAGTGGRADAIHNLVAASRHTEWRGPVINGGNCLGIRSRPGRYDTLFVPRHKFPAPGGPVTPLALISQSGAFAVAKLSKLDTLNPKFVVSIGNQVDLTAGDWLAYLKDDPSVDVFACYLEGFPDGDGEAWLEAAAEIAASGRTVLLYRAGRTAAGARATASHTARVAGDYAVTRELARQAGVVVADTLADFEDLVRLFCMLGGKSVSGRRLGAVSNAGFECVAIADRAGRFRLEPFGPECRERARALLDRYRLSGVVEAANPLDLTPIVDDAGFEEAVVAVLEDPHVDVAVVGCVPHSGALATLAPACDRDDGLAARLGRVQAAHAKAWIVVVDAGSLYDPFAARLERLGLPVFRTADRALELFGIFCEARLEP